MPLTLDIGAAAIGALGLLVAILANRRAKKANEHAETANSIAADALAQAREANRIAEDANQLSQDANTIVRGQAARESERWFVDWSCKWDKEGSVLTLVNTGSHTALDVAVVVQGDDLHHVAEGQGDVEPGGKIVLPLPEVGEKRSERRQKNARDVESFHRSGIAWFPSGFKLDATVVLTWSTGLGRPDRKVIEETLT